MKQPFLDPLNEICDVTTALQMHEESLTVPGTYSWPSCSFPPSYLNVAFPSDELLMIKVSNPAFLDHQLECLAQQPFSHTRWTTISLLLACYRPALPSLTSLVHPPSSSISLCVSHKTTNASVTVLLIFFFVTILVDKHQMWFTLYIWWCLSSAIYGRCPANIDFYETLYEQQHSEQQHSTNKENLWTTLRASLGTMKWHWNHTINLGRTWAKSFVAQASLTNIYMNICARYDSLVTKILQILLNRT